jgi:hypothetical protein
MAAVEMGGEVGEERSGLLGAEAGDDLVAAFCPQAA